MKPVARAHLQPGQRYKRGPGSTSVFQVVAIQEDSEQSGLTLEYWTRVEPYNSGRIIVGYFGARALVYVLEDGEG